MNAGKSTVLLQSSYNYRERGLQTLLFAPKCDTRFGSPGIHSRIGLKQSAHLFEQDFDFYFHLKQHIKTREAVHCILIDEGHFLTKMQVAQLIMITKRLTIPTLCYGLRSDFLGEPFSGSQYLLAWADELVEIKTICHCGSKATMNMRIDKDKRPIESGAQIQIGGNESYLSVCMKHFVEAIKNIENSAKKILSGAET